jgi:hypothetical protein
MELIAIQQGSQEFRPDEYDNLPLWSTGLVASVLATNPLTLFHYGIGNAVAGDTATQPEPADLMDTNLTDDSGQMTVDEGMKVLSTGLEVFAVGDAPAADIDAGMRADRPFPSGPDLKRLHRDLLIAFYMGTRSYQYMVPLANVATGWDVIPTTAGGRLQDAPAVIRGQDGFLIGFQGWQKMDSHLLHQPYYNIAADQTFGVDIIAPNLGQVTGLTRQHELRCYLFGLRRRPIR